MCIYYSGRNNLHYDSGEHIFPAGIGGKRMLPIGYVSSEFNNDISKLEQEFMRDSFVAMGREIEGPGKRGKLGGKYATKSKVHVVKNVSDTAMFALGYVKQGKSYEIPHIALDIKTRENSFSFNYEAEKDALTVVAEFKESCMAAELLSMRTIESEELPADLILFGIQEGIEENYNSFFAKHPSNNLSFEVNTIKNVGNGINTGGQAPERLNYMPQSKLSVKFSLEHFRIYGKMAFNFLASIMGKEFVLNERFDQVRNWIAYGGINNFARLIKKDDNPLTAIGISLPTSSHFILIAKVENKLIAKVYLYESLGVEIEILPNFPEPFSTNGCIFDWRAQKEYLFNEYLSIIVRGNIGKEYL
jgi:hypothetical protein